MNGYVIFSDLKGFSKLTEPELRLFYKNLLPDVAEELKELKTKAEVWNTWGDAILAIFQDGRDAIELALKYRDFFKTYDFSSLGIKELKPRIAAHFGEFEIFNDPLLGAVNILGTNINTTARIEPITRPGEIFVTQQFKHAIENLPDSIQGISFGELGLISLAKNFGDREIYRLYRAGESRQIIDRILKADLSQVLPEAPKMTVNEINTIEFYKKVPTSSKLRQLLKHETIEDNTGEFLIELAGICKSYGLYEEAIAYIIEAEKRVIEVNGIKVYPYKHQTKLIKLKANAMTRLGKYEEAADIIYGLWQYGMKDSDTLSMLAAQYKRRSLFSDGNVLPRDQINIELLIRAKDLYLEAFRLDIGDYYPAINAAYLFKIIGGIEEGKGVKLASYIVEAWDNRRGESWWLDSTLAEAELLQGDIEEANKRFNQALDRHKPDEFEKRSVYEQIYSYLAVNQREDQGGTILKMLGEDI